uniref:Uncharacterized protein n=1 Tax=Vitis vinifera TaxID=29760 RepID=A5B6T6_VITVI|nr:hypothetical protein VITISV_043881 [Vitis vinifera]
MGHFDPKLQYQTMTSVPTVVVPEVFAQLSIDNVQQQPSQPAQFEGPQAGPWALDIPRARPVDQSTSSVARPGLGHGPWALLLRARRPGLARWRPLGFDTIYKADISPEA